MPVPLPPATVAEKDRRRMRADLDRAIAETRAEANRHRCPVHGHDRRSYRGHCPVADCPGNSLVPGLHARARVRMDGRSEIIIAGGSCAEPHEAEQYPRGLYRHLVQAIRAADDFNRQSRAQRRHLHRRYAAIVAELEAG